MIKEKRPSLVFLMETKLRSRKMERIRCKVGFKNLFVVDSIGKGGGLALFWNEDLKMEIKNFSSRHINGVVTIPLTDQQWKFTGFYGQPDVSKRREGWDILKHLATQIPEPWLCIGDFNEVLTMSEKWGGGERANSQMREFQLTLEICDFSDLGYIGSKFTWSNCKEDHEFIKERLDRGVANTNWRELFPEVEITVEAVTTSDHAVLWASLSRQQHGFSKNKGFRYETSWAVGKEYYEVCARAWNASLGQGDIWNRVGQKLSTCKSDLLRWKRETWGKSRQTIKSLQHRLNGAYDSFDTQAGSDLKNIK
jgi:hypothetical protein